MKRSFLYILIMAFLGLTSAPAATVYSTFGQNDEYNNGPGQGWTIGDVIGSGDLATPFYVGSQAYNFTSVEIAVAKPSDSPAEDVWVWIFSDNNGMPGTVMEELYYDGIPAGEPDIVQLNSSTNPGLAADTTYWVAAGRTPDLEFNSGDLTWHWNMVNPIFGDQLYRRFPGDPTWLPSSTISTVPAFRINGTAAPIPGAVWLLGSGLIGLAALRKRFKK